MARTETIEAPGTVRHALPDARFRVALDNGHQVLARVAMAVRGQTIRVTPGDRVTVELSPFDLSRGRITGRKR